LAGGSSPGSRYFQSAGGFSISDTAPSSGRKIESSEAVGFSDGNLFLPASTLPDSFSGLADSGRLTGNGGGVAICLAGDADSLTGDISACGTSFFATGGMVMGVAEGVARRGS
jgi:hypothetical protein